MSHRVHPQYLKQLLLEGNTEEAIHFLCAQSFDEAVARQLVGELDFTLPQNGRQAAQIASKLLASCPHLASRFLGLYYGLPIDIAEQVLAQAQMSATANSESVISEKALTHSLNSWNPRPAPPDTQVPPKGIGGINRQLLDLITTNRYEEAVKLLTCKHELDEHNARMYVQDLLRYESRVD